MYNMNVWHAVNGSLTRALSHHQALLSLPKRRRRELRPRIALLEDALHGCGIVGRGSLTARGRTQQGASPLSAAASAAVREALGALTQELESIPEDEGTELKQRTLQLHTALQHHLPRTLDRAQQATESAGVRTPRAGVPPDTPVHVGFSAAEWGKLSTDQQQQVHTSQRMLQGGLTLMARVVQGAAFVR